MELMKRLPLSQELLEYYRKRLQSAEEEKLSIIESLKACEVKHSDMHQLQWMLSEREEEILALQRAVKDQELLLFEQQEQILELRAENHQLRMQEMEDRRRIQQLLSLTKPITQEVTFMRDSRPTKLTAALSGRPTDGVAQNGSSSANSSTVEIVCPGSSALPKETPRQNVSESRIPSTGDATPRFATRMLRTVYLPSEKSDSMLLTIDALRRELEEYKRAGEAKVSAVMEQREQVLAESKAQTERLLAQTRELQERTTTLSTLLRNNEREYLLLRHNTSVHERLMKEDNEALKAQNEQLLADHDQHKDRAEHDMQEHATHMARQTENYVKTFRAHAHDHMKEKDNLEEMLAKERIEAKAQREVLEERVKKMAEKLKRLDKIRRLNEQRQKWEAVHNPDGHQQGPGKGGTATGSTLLYDRFAAGFSAEQANKSVALTMEPPQGAPLDAPLDARALLLALSGRV